MKSQLHLSGIDKFGPEFAPAENEDELKLGML